MRRHLKTLILLRLSVLLQENMILEIAKQNDKEVDARDGSAWSIVQYEKGDIVWERKPDYIYGIEPLEAIANILISLKNK